MILFGDHLFNMITFTYIHSIPLLQVSYTCTPHSTQLPEFPPKPGRLEKGKLLDPFMATFVEGHAYRLSRWKGDIPRCDWQCYLVALVGPGRLQRWTASCPVEKDMIDDMGPQGNWWFNHSLNGRTKNGHPLPKLCGIILASYDQTHSFFPTQCAVAGGLAKSVHLSPVSQTLWTSNNIGCGERFFMTFSLSCGVILIKGRLICMIFWGCLRETNWWL